MADDSGVEGIDEVTLEPAATVVRSPRPRALWGVLAAAVVAAGALAISSGGGDDGGPPRLPVALGASTARSESDAAMAADSMLMWVTYRAGDDLPMMGGSAAAYRLPGGQEEAAIAALHEALAIDGPLTEQAGFWQAEGSDGRYIEVFKAPGYPWWYSDNIDMVGNAGGGSSGDVGVAVAPAPACVAPEPGTAPEDCRDTMHCEVGVECRALPVDEPDPADLPSEDDARRIALEFLAAAGVDVEDANANVTVEGPYDAWYVSVEPRLGGVPVAGLSADASVGSEGVVTSASGFLASPQRLDEYPLIDTRTAIDRLNAQMGTPFGTDVAVARDAAEDAPATTLYDTCEEPPDGGGGCAGTDGSPGEIPPVGPTCEVLEPAGPGEIEVEGGTTGADLDPALPCIVPEPDPCYQAVPPQDDEGVRTEPDVDCVEPQPMPTPEPEEVVLTEVEPVLVMLPADDGTNDSYLIPGYRFSNADGHMVEVAAVADEALSSPGADTTVADTVVPEPAPVDPPDNVPYPGCETLVEEDPTGTTHTIQPCPTPSPGAIPDPVHLEPGTEPAVGVGYYVDLDLQCPVVILGSTIWVPADEAIGTWDVADETHEGGTFTIEDEDSAQFFGDAGMTKRASYRPVGPAEDPCIPSPRP